MSNSFDNPKELKFIITLGVGTFGSGSSNQITLQGFRAVVDIDKAGGMMMGTLKAQIYGVAQSDINSATTLQWKPGAFIPNTIQVFAIDGDQETLVFTGNIINAWGNYQNMPDVFFMVQAQAAYFAQIKPVPPTSYKGSFDVVTMMQQLAGQMGLTFENNGVSGKTLTNQYLPNTYLEQAKTVAAAAGIWMFIDNGILAITPQNQARSKPIPNISKDTGMVGFPTFDGVGVNFQVLFNPAIVFGGSIQIDTSIPQAKGIWIVTSVALRLESEKPGGGWFMTIRGNKSGLAVVTS
jgi:hypothetical protein